MTDVKIYTMHLHLGGAILPLPVPFLPRIGDTIMHRYRGTLTEHMVTKVFHFTTLNSEGGCDRICTDIYTEAVDA